MKIGKFYLKKSFVERGEIKSQKYEKNKNIKEREKSNKNIYVISSIAVE